MDNSQHDDDKLHGDKLLRAMAEHVRGEVEVEDGERLDRRWDAYCAGTLAAPERFLKEAGSSPDSRLAAKLFEPLGDNFKTDLARELRRVAASETSTTTEQPSGLSTPEAPSASAPDGPSDGKSRWRRWIRGLWGGGNFRSLQLAVITLGLMVSVGLLQLTRPGTAPTPRFELEVLGAATERSSPGLEAETVLLEPGLRFRLRLRPENPIEDHPSLRVYVRQAGGELERWRTAERAATAHPGGVVLIEDPEWGFPPGEWTLYLAIGHSLPRDVEIREFLDRQSGSLQSRSFQPQPPSEHWQLLAREIRVGEAKAR